MYKFIFLLVLFLGQTISIYTNDECVEGDCENGKGVYVNEEGVRFEGNFVNGHLQGKRERIVLPDGSYYEGRVVNGLANGKGVFIQKSGEKYLGQFKDGQYHGQGKRLTAEGDFYEGEFKEDLYDGNGTIRYKDGLLYVGKFKKGKRHGAGTLYKKMYDGVWDKDVRKKEGEQ